MKRLLAGLALLFALGLFGQQLPYQRNAITTNKPAAMTNVILSISGGGSGSAVTTNDTRPLFLNGPITITNATTFIGDVSAPGKWIIRYSAGDGYVAGGAVGWDSDGNLNLLGTLFASGASLTNALNVNGISRLTSVNLNNLTNTGIYWQTNAVTGAWVVIGTNAHILRRDQFGTTNLTATNGYFAILQTNGNFNISSNGSNSISGIYSGNGAGLSNVVVRVTNINGIYPGANVTLTTNADGSISITAANSINNAGPFNAAQFASYGNQTNIATGGPHTNIIIYGSVAGTNWLTVDTNGVLNTNSGSGNWYRFSGSQGTVQIGQTNGTATITLSNANGTLTASNGNFGTINSASFTGTNYMTTQPGFLIYNVTNWGAIPDGKIGWGAAIAAGSKTLTISATGPNVFSAGDVGKSIMVIFASTNTLQGPVARAISTNCLVTSITNFGSSTSVTLSNAALNGVSSVSCIWGTDLSSNLMAAWSWGATNSPNGSAIYHPPGIYVCSRDPLDPAPDAFHTNFHHNAQIFLPPMSATGQVARVLKLYGPLRPVEQQAGTQDQLNSVGATIWSFCQATNGAKLFACDGPTNGTSPFVGNVTCDLDNPKTNVLYYFNDVGIEIENMTFNLPVNPSIKGLDLRCALNAQLKNVVVDTGYATCPGAWVPPPTSTNNCGVLMPNNFCGGENQVQALKIRNMYNALTIGEHSFGAVEIVNCWNGLFTASSSGHWGGVWTLDEENVANLIAVQQCAPELNAFITTENNNAGTWVQSSVILNDSLAQLKGTLWVQNTTGGVVMTNVIAGGSASKMDIHYVDSSQAGTNGFIGTLRLMGDANAGNGQPMMIMKPQIDLNVPIRFSSMDGAHYWDFAKAFEGAGGYLVWNHDGTDLAKFDTSGNMTIYAGQYNGKATGLTNANGNALLDTSATNNTAAAIKIGTLNAITAVNASALELTNVPQTAIAGPFLTTNAAANQVQSSYNGASITNYTTTFWTNVVNGATNVNSTTRAQVWYVAVAVSEPAATLGSAEIDAQIQRGDGVWQTVAGLDIAGGATSILQTNKDILVFPVASGQSWRLTNSVSGTGYVAGPDTTKTNSVILY